MSRFGSLNDPQLDAFSFEAYHAAGRYGKLFEFNHLVWDGLKFTSGKNYTASGNIPLSDKRETSFFGNLAVVLFGPTDGTGNPSDFRYKDVDVAEDYLTLAHKEGVLPRRKTQVILEVALPLFSAIGDKKVNHFCSLDELGIVEKESARPSIEKLWTIGTKTEEYYRQWHRGENRHPRAYMTVGDNNSGERIGDPHAIVARSTVPFYQAVGFISITDPANPLLKVLQGKSIKLG